MCQLHIDKLKNILPEEFHVYILSNCGKTLEDTFFLGVGLELSFGVLYLKKTTEFVGEVVGKCPILNCVEWYRGFDTNPSVALLKAIIRALESNNDSIYQ